VLVITKVVDIVAEVIVVQILKKTVCTFSTNTLTVSVCLTGPPLHSHSSLVSPQIRLF